MRWPTAAPPTGQLRTDLHPDLTLRFAVSHNAAQSLGPEEPSIRVRASERSDWPRSVESNGVSYPLHALHAPACPAVEVFNMTENSYSYASRCKDGVSPSLAAAHLAAR